MTTEQMDALEDIRRKERGQATIKEEDIEEGPQRITIYTNPEGTEFVDKVPTGKLDGWEGRQVYADTWYNYINTKSSLDYRIREMQKADTKAVDARERLLEEWDQNL